MALLINAPRGTKDILPADVYQWHYVEGVARGVAADFGFTEIRFPTFEHTELFVRGVGDTTDVVQKEMYTFNDKGGRSISLRPEGTASVVRSYLENALYAAGLPAKMYYIVPNFRYEKPQAGRLREHHQFGVECFGSPRPEADAEIIALAAEYLRRLGIRQVKLAINSIGCPACRPAYHAALKAYFSAREDALCPTCRERLSRNPMRILDCKNEACQEIAAGAPVGLDFLCGDCLAHMDAVEARLEAMGIVYAVDPRIVRGLDYYTRTVFEFISTSIGAQGTVLGGGRYDGLVSQLGGQATPGLGFGSGIERVLLVMEAEGVVIPKPEATGVFVAAQSPETALAVGALVNELRRAGVSAESDLLGRSLKAQMKYAGKTARYALVVGQDELQSGTAALKNLSTGEQTACTLTARDIAAHIHTTEVSSI